MKEFWDIYHYIEDHSITPVLNHSCDPDLIAINLIQFEQEVNSRRGTCPARADLMRVLPSSRQHKFKEAGKSVHSAIASRHNKTIAEGEDKLSPKVRCYVFEK